MAVMWPEAGMVAVARSLGGEHGAGRQALGRDQDRHLLGRGLEHRSGHRGTDQHQGDAEADLPGTALVGGGGQTKTTARLDRRAVAAKADRVGAVVAIGTPVLQLFTDSIWATFNEDVPWVVRLGSAPADPLGPAQATLQVTVAVIGKAASFGLPSGEGWPAEVVV